MRHEIINTPPQELNSTVAWMVGAIRAFGRNIFAYNPRIAWQAMIQTGGFRCTMNMWRHGTLTKFGTQVEKSVS